jgi:hypothetical protein
MVTEFAVDRAAKCAESSAAARSPQDLSLSLPENASRAAAKMVGGSGGSAVLE